MFFKKKKFNGKRSVNRFGFGGSVYIGNVYAP